MSKGRRLAVVLGSNGPSAEGLEPLRYARRDAEKVLATLTRPECGFAVAAPSPDSDATTALSILERVVESCSKDDEFICYFSGHGILAHGTLVLLWDDTDLDRVLGTAIPIARIMTALSFCQARNRLLVLDCCHAGAAAGMLGLKSAASVPFEDLGLTSANHLVLMASDRLERARELESAGGSFMTTSICAALTNRSNKADRDGDGLVSVQDLAGWLVSEAQSQNLTSEKVSVPYLAGQSRGPFHLTREREWPVWKVLLPNGDTATVLPGPPDRGPLSRTSNWHFALVAVADHLVTNAQYRDFVKHGGARPHGSEFADGAWRDPFDPWGDSRFSAATKPVVCVDTLMAKNYCMWLAKRAGPSVLVGPGGERCDVAIADVDLLTVAEWERACRARLGYWWLPLPVTVPGALDCLGGQASVHDNADRPASVHEDSRANDWGITDLVGNVWEWCYSRYAMRLAPALLTRRTRTTLIDRDFEARGGGFLDHVGRIDLAVNAAALADGMYTRHSDLGFRVAVALHPRGHIPDFPFEVLETEPIDSYATLAMAPRLIDVDL